MSIFAVDNRSLRIYALTMDAITTNYIPREWLALVINTCRIALEKLPEAYLWTRKINGVMTPVCVVENHRYTKTKEVGRSYFEQAEKREKYEAELKDAECKWYAWHRGPVPEDIKPRRVIRRLNTGNGNTVILNKDYFDSLKNDADPSYPESKKYFFNGVYYRSVAEKEIAEFYTVNNIPFKYEPEIWVDGMNKPINPDFVIFIKELDCCKFHEHFGMMNNLNYLRNTKNKYVMYTEAGLVPDLDILFTYDTEELPFDIRTMWPRLNSMVYCSLFAK